MPHPTLKFGRAPRTFGHVTSLARLRATRGAPLPPLPVSLNNAEKLPKDVGMLGNSVYGDCTCAAMAHAIQVVTLAAQGSEATVTEAETLAAYSAITGFRPGPPPVHDDGAVEQDVLRYWQREGFPLAGGTLKAGPAFEVNPGDLTGICEGIQEFGFCFIGFTVPYGFMDATQDGPPDLWGDDPAYSGSEGGHAVILTGFNRTTPGQYSFDVISWGTNGRYTMRQDFVARYVDEIYAVLLPPWLNATGANPYDLTAEQLRALGGQVGQELGAT